MMDVSQPPPQLTAPSHLATNIGVPPPMPGSHGHYRPHYHHHGNPNKPYFKSFGSGGFQRPHQMTQDDFDGKRLRKSVMRKTVDYNASIVKKLDVSGKEEFVNIFKEYQLTNHFYYRPVCGNVIIGIDSHCSLRVYMFQSCYLPPAIWITLQML